MLLSNIILTNTNSRFLSSASTSPSGTCSRQAIPLPRCSDADPPHRPIEQQTNSHSRLQKSLETFFGVGNHTSSRLLARFNIHPTCRVGELANKQVLDLTAVLSDMKIENDLRREVLNDIKRLKETGTYRGRRHALGLPVRGQRTRTQIKTPVRLNRMERKL
ncbi:37S ribosomal protein SWS2 [Penicillium argentinense]|uniref:37S ribosomal protein SWS2 n=1 Tax=Penicillium argentinense TaxID=1131581 RepID=A0A9W9G581_9EURO|nr:37S ribosomal protein SWS2 [Penicillium argentinense]KAJ5112328.1 37S ribosomal protein SWS2 [Penicillium argentinense]